VRVVLQLAYGAVIIGLVAIMTAAFSAVCLAGLMVVRFFPIIGKKHRHSDWERLNR
jgi:hypothetical protein